MLRRTQNLVGKPRGLNPRPPGLESRKIPLSHGGWRPYGSIVPYCSDWTGAPWRRSGTTQAKREKVRRRGESEEARGKCTQLWDSGDTASAAQMRTAACGALLDAALYSVHPVRQPIVAHRRHTQLPFSSIARVVCFPLLVDVFFFKIYINMEFCASMVAVFYFKISWFDFAILNAQCLIFFYF